ncbi:hypothetical protein AAHC03_025951 [Spirometra sp. Aus1]
MSSAVAPKDDTNNVSEVSANIEFDELFDVPDSIPPKEVDTCASENKKEITSDEHTQPEMDLDPSNSKNDSVNSTKESEKEPAKCISPIQWDLLSDGEQLQDTLHVDAPEDEFSREEEEETQPKSILDASTESFSQDSLKDTADHELPEDLRRIFVNTRYFLIKSNNHENVDIAKKKNAWATPTANESRLNKAFFDYDNVILIFSVRESGRFQGYARLSSPSDPRMHISWVLPPRMSSNLLSSPFKLDWISKQELPFPKTVHLNNAWNENKPVKIGRDGQEIEPVCGEALCRLFPVDKPSKLPDILSKIESHKPSGDSHRRNAFERLGMADNSRPHGSGSRRMRDFGFQNSNSVGLLGAATGARYQTGNRRSILPGSATLQGPFERLPIGGNPSVSSRLGLPTGMPGPTLGRMTSSSASEAFNMEPKESSQRRSRGYPRRSSRRGRSRSSSYASDVKGHRSSSSNGYRSGSYRDRESYRRPSRTRSRASRERSPPRHQSAYHRDQRNNVGSVSPSNKNFINWNYEDYVQQVSRGLQPNLTSLRPDDQMRSLLSNSGDDDRRYEERVDAFLRNLRSGKSRSRTFSPSPSPPPPRRHHHHHPEDSHTSRGQADYRYGGSSSGGQRGHRSPVEHFRASRSRRRGDYGTAEDDDDDFLEHNPYIRAQGVSSRGRRSRSRSDNRHHRHFDYDDHEVEEEDDVLAEADDYRWQTNSLLRTPRSGGARLARQRSRSYSRSRGRQHR